MNTPTINDDFHEVRDALLEIQNQNKAELKKLKVELIQILVISVNKWRRVFRIGLVMGIVNPTILTIVWFSSHRIDWIQLIFGVLWLIWTIYAYIKLRHAKWELKMFTA